MKTKLIIIALLFTQIKLFCQEERIDKLFTDVFSKATATFPSDSASLYQFYFKWFPATDVEKKQKQIDRINSLLTEPSIKRYCIVERKLKPLMTNIVADNKITKNQLYEFLTLYCDYDYFTSEALFSKLLTNDENYSLVWKTFQIITEASKTDTIYISALIEFNEKIKTNVELAETIPFLILETIQNNPNGFLDMYLARGKETRYELIEIIIEMLSENLVISCFTNIYEHTKNDTYKKTSMEIIQKLKQ